MIEQERLLSEELAAVLTERRRKFNTKKYPDTERGVLKWAKDTLDLVDDPDSEKLSAGKIHKGRSPGEWEIKDVWDEEEEMWANYTLKNFNSPDFDEELEGDVNARWRRRR